MRKAFFVFIFTVLFLINASSVSAGLITVNKDGGVVWNVLADEDAIGIDIPKSSSVEVTKTADSKPPNDAKVNLTKEDGKISLVVESGNEKRQLDISNWQNDVVEVEERPEVQKVNIGISDGKFTIAQKGVIAETDYPINIDTKSAKISVTTQTGQQYLSILPKKAVDVMLQGKFINDISASDKLQLTQEGSGDLTYRIKGRRILNFFNFYFYPVDVSGEVSATTGEVVSFDEPNWLRVVSFLFT